MSGWLGLLLGCGRVVPADPGDGAAGFPHPEDYAAHAADALADPAGCANCHDLSAEEPGDGPDARVGPACRSCHAWPHAEAVREGAVHGAAWAENPGDCAGCHGADGRRVPAGIERGRCTSCHHSYPHVEGFLAEHGAAVGERGRPDACVGCHPAGAAGEGAAGEGACVSCHPAYPHPPAWRAEQGHERVVDEGCAACHAAPEAGVPGCRSCHATWPHPADWSRSHLTPVQAQGEGACRTCHAVGTPAGPELPVSCAASCHTSPSAWSGEAP